MIATKREVAEDKRSLSFKKKIADAFKNEKAQKINTSNFVFCSFF